MTRLRPLLRQAAFRSGVLSLARYGVRRALTAVMFHRVIDPSDPDFALADPVYTVSAPLFEQLLGFFHDHYAVVDIHSVMNAYEGSRGLPDHALLITFDDGWADNLRYAAPLLRARAMPAVIFVAAEAVAADTMTWWQEDVFAANRFGWNSQDRSSGNADDPVGLVTRLALMDEKERDRLLERLPRQPCHARMMLTANELRCLADFGIDVGLHGYRHVPLVGLDDVASELADARDAIATMTADTAVTAALGCPHGRYDDKVVAAARSVGIKLVFTSDKRLNATRQGMLTPMRPLGRIGIAAEHIQAAPHRLDPAAAARWLWPRDCQ